MEFNRRAHPECIYASNPYHECAGGCLEKIAQRKGATEKKKPASKLLSFSGSFGRKKHNNKSNSSTEGYENGDENKPIYSDELRVFPSFVADQAKITSPTPRKQVKEERNNEPPPELKEKPKGFDFLAALKQSDGNSDSEEEETESVISESVASVGRYHVRSDVSSTLESIIAKHGDIAANCQLASASMRARYLECLCSVVQELKSTSFEDLTKSKLKEMLAVVKDVESVKVEAGWLREALEKLLEAVEVENQRRALEEEKANHDLALDETRQELESCIKDLAQREKEVVEAKARLAATRARLSELELEGPKLDEAVSSFRSKVDKFREKNVIGKML